MGGLKEIRRRISSVKSTKQITRAMKLVSAAKLRKAQEAAEGGRQFRDQLQVLLDDVRNDVSEQVAHPLQSEREEVRRRLVVVIAGERGLCGGYNANIFKRVKADLAKNFEGSFETENEFMLIGRRAVSAGRRQGWNVLQSHEGLPEAVAAWPTSEIAREISQRFTTEAVDEVLLYFTEFKSAMTQEVRRSTLLPFEYAPLDESEQHTEQERSEPNNKYDPAPEMILEQLLPLLLQTSFVQAALESKASEHAARMTAMDAATNNADELTEKLRVYYNRARQSAITSELIDIIGGTEAAQ